MTAQLNAALVRVEVGGDARTFEANEAQVLVLTALYRGAEDRGYEW